MTLHEAIQKVLKESNSPLSARDIASVINLKGYYHRADRGKLESGQILSRVRKYPLLFQNINGQIVLIEDADWKNLLTSYWYLVNTLRGIYIVADIQFIIAVLLFYKRIYDINKRAGRQYPLDIDKGYESLLEKILDGENTWIENLNSLENLHIAPIGIFDECSRLLSKLDTHKKIEIWSVIKQINTSEFEDEEFGNMFEYLLNLDSLDGYKSTLNHTPYSLRELMVFILNPSPGKLIYDPVAGTGGLLIQAIRHNKTTNPANLKGTEINKRIAQLGNMNLAMHGLKNVQINAKDCFEEINDSTEYDYIIADLPVNGITNSIEHFMLYQQFGLQAPKSGKGFGSLVLLVLSKLKEDGKAVITVSDGFLVKKGKEKEIRDLLIAYDVIESIISLPYGTLRPYTDAKASVIVLNKNKSFELVNRIQFITGRAVDQDAKSLDLNNDEILLAFKSKALFSKDTQVIDISDLRPDTNLSADAYDAQFISGNAMLKDGSGRMLSDLVEIRAGIQPEKADMDNDGDIPLIKIENLSRDILDIDLSKEMSNKIHLSSKYNRSTINEECILIARIGDNLKPTIFRPNNHDYQIIIHGGVYALIPGKGSKAVDIEYLYYQLHSSFVQEQIEKRRLGAVMPYISISGLKQVVIPYMDIDSQRSFIDTQKANLISGERIRVEERLRALGYKEEAKQTESDIVRTLVHQLRPTLLNMDLEVKKIKRIIDKNTIGRLKEDAEGIIEIEEIEDLEISDSAIKVQNYTLEEIVDKLKNDTLRLNEVLTTVNDVMSFKLSLEDFKSINVLLFFQEYLHQKEIDVDGRFKISVTGESFKAEINVISFKELIDQLLLNAEKHGFKESKIPKSKRVVYFSIRANLERGIAIIEYHNNGESFKMRQEDFIKPFYKSQKSDGSGIGGNYIFRIIQAHGGKMTVKEDLRIGFSIVFELPLTQVKEYE